MANREQLAIIRSARAGQASAQLALGKLYLFGSAGLPLSVATALHWLGRAAQQDCEEAWILIGRHVPLETALQSPQALQLCIWYERAFDAGVIEAGLVLAKLVLSHPDHPLTAPLRRKALLALASAAHTGLADAQWLLAQQNPDMQDLPMQNNALAQPSLKTKVEESATLTWTTRAADGGITQAQLALAENAWAAGDWPLFLRWALPLARTWLHWHSQDMTTPESSKTSRQRMTRQDAKLISRCAQALSHLPRTSDAEADEILQLWELAAQEEDKLAQFSLGLWYARMDANGVRVASGTGSANFKKAIRCLTQAGEQGMADAWYALSRIYLKAEFSQRNVSDAQKYLERAANLGHCAAQLACGTHAWRMRRENQANDTRAVYWLQKAAMQGDAEAANLLKKITARCAPTAWIQAAHRHLTREQISSHPFLAARIELAALFNLTRAEALLLDLNSADHGYCIVVDIGNIHGRGKRRLILLQSNAEREALDRITRLFKDVDCGINGPEGNYRQRLYRLKTLLPHLDSTDSEEGLQ